MSAQLRIASLWMPRYMMEREIDRIRTTTNAALDRLIAKQGLAVRTGVDETPVGGLDEKRAAMTKGHLARVEALVRTMGRERAISAARETLFETGVKLGRDAKTRLRVSDSEQDLVRAAGVMYRILGIEFSVAKSREGWRMMVDRCALSKGYTHDACLMLSAVDEGVVSGLNPRASMLFTERMTDGLPRCAATINIKEEE